MKDDSYPGLYQHADAASLSAQKTYLVLQRVHIGSLVLGSMVGALGAFTTKESGVWFYSATAIILVLGILCLWATRSRKDEKIWFDCRAIAESTKTATWRFMMGAPPFTEKGSSEKSFVADLQDIRQARPGSEQYLAGQINADVSAITDFMKEMRGRSFDERKAFYVEARLRDQKLWYSKKANMNSRSGTRWFWATTGLQGLAVAISIIEAASGGFQVNVVPILTTCVAAVAAWSQMKRHGELAQTYALAAQELEELESIAGSLTDEKDFPQLVEQVEESVSREHTMWCARRDVRLETQKKEDEKHG